MKKLMALVLLVCLIVSALPVSAAQYIPELQVDMGYFSWQPAYAARDDGGIAIAFVYGGYCGDEWIEPEELRVDARTDMEGVSFTCSMDADSQCVYVYGAEAADKFFYTVDVYYDARNAHWESAPLEIIWNSRNYETTIGHESIIVGEIGAIYSYGKALEPDGFEIYAYSDSENVDIFAHRNDESGLNRVMLYYDEAQQGEKVTVQVNCFTKDRGHFLYKTFMLEVR